MQHLENAVEHLAQVAAIVVSVNRVRAGCTKKEAKPARNQHLPRKKYFFRLYTNLLTVNRRLVRFRAIQAKAIKLRLIATLLEPITKFVETQCRYCGRFACEYSRHKRRVKGEITIILCARLD